MSDWENAEIDYWKAAAEQIKPEILAEITKPPPPTLFQRLRDYWNKPRGTNTIIASQCGAMSNMIRTMQGRP